MSGRKNEDGTALPPEALVAFLVVGTGVYLARSGRLWVVVLGGALAVIMVAACWAVVPSRCLPRNRERAMRVRLRLRLYPGRGHATVLGLWLRWGRFAAWRHSHRIRGMMPALVPGSAPRLPFGAPGPRALPPRAAGQPGLACGGAEPAA